MRYMTRVIWIAILGSMIQAVWGGSFVYSTQRREVKVCNLIFPGFVQNDPLAYENPDPYLFYVLDRRTDLKPLNMEFVNPLAPTRVTAAVINRWQARMDRTGQGYQLGQPVTKNMGCYWEVDITTASADALAQFDLIFITNHRNNVKFRAEDREKLRRAADGGATVWIEDCGNFTIDPNFPFFLDMNFRSQGAVGTTVVVSPNHPVLTTPYTLTWQEIAELGEKARGNFHITNVDRTGPPDPVLVPILNNSGSGLPYLAAGQFGSGFVVASAGDSGCEINDYVGGSNGGFGGNSGPYSGELVALARAEDLKLVYNIVSWGFASPTFQK
ncbi:MAG: hypothetical protein IT210_02545, partial [Armatimonadetes bacterium]|nr:hypothetical protein [Armatimonadota bacterium]